MSAPPRPWFRLASMVRPADPTPPPQSPPPPPPQQPPPPTTTITTTTTTTTTNVSNPQSPKKPPPSPPPSAAASTPKKDPTTTPPRAEPRSPPVVAIKPPTFFMSPGVPNFTQTSNPSPKLNDKLPSPAAAAAATDNAPFRGIITGSRSKTATPSPQSSPYKPKSPSMGAPPPSPLLLPPPQISAINNEPEQKTVLVQEPAAAKTTSFHQLHSDTNVDSAARSINGATAPHHNQNHQLHHGADKIITTNKQEQPSSNSKMQNNKKKLDSADKEAGMKVITIAGENRGAIMELVRSPASGKSIGRRFNNKVMSDNNEQESYSSGSGKEAAGNRQCKKKSNKDKLDSSVPMTAFMNSNVQGVNNSILFNAQCTHHDPGVHVSLARKHASSNHNKSKAHNAVKG